MKLARPETSKLLGAGFSALDLRATRLTSWRRICRAFGASPTARIRVRMPAIVAVVVCLLSSMPAMSQSASAPVEHLKIENGAVWSHASGQWQKKGDATLGTAVKALEDIYPQATIAMNPKLQSLKLADLQVRASDPEADLEALRAACGSQFDLDLSRRGMSLYALAPNEVFEREKQQATGAKEIQVFSLTGYLEQRDKDADPAKMVDQLQGVINETIGDLDDSIAPPKFRFHKDANLLVVIGTPQAIDVAGKVISALPGQQTPWYRGGAYGAAYGFGGGGAAGGGYSYTVGDAFSSRKATTDAWLLREMGVPRAPSGLPADPTATTAPGGATAPPAQKP